MLLNNQPNKPTQPVPKVITHFGIGYIKCPACNPANIRINIQFLRSALQASIF